MAGIPACLCLFLFLFFSSPSSAPAYTNGWQGWPCPTNTDWSLVDTNHYFFQLYTALVERCTALNVSFAPIVDSGVILYNGYTNAVITTNALTVTNQILLYKTVSLTNQFLPFEYTWSNPVASGVATCTPPVRRSWFINWDDTLFTICSSYVNTNQIGTDGTFNAYFAGITNLGASASFPMLPATQLFAVAAIGWTNRSVPHWTHSCIITNSDWLLASIHSGSNTPTAWYFKRWTDLTNMHPASALYAPVAEYVPAGTNALTNLPLTIYGTAWGATGTNVLSATNEAIAFTSTNPIPLALSWRSITGIVCAATRPNSNDAIRITYRVVPPLYDYDVGWRLTPESLNERKACVDLLRWTTSYPTVRAPWDVGQTDYWKVGSGNGPGLAGSQTDCYNLWVTNNGQGLWYATVFLINTDVHWVYQGARNTYLDAVSLTTNYAKTAELYIMTSVAKYATVSTNNVYYTWGLPFAQDQYTMVGSTNYSGGECSSLTNYFPLYTTEIGTNLPWEVIGLTPLSAAGYNLNGARWLIRWDGTNGFRYK